MPRCGGPDRGLADDDAIDEPELELERRTERSSGNDLPIADTAHPIDQRNHQILFECRILQSVVHDEGLGAPFDGQAGGGAVPVHSLSGSCPRGILTHDPAEPGRLHFWQSPEHEPLQHTPSTQFPDEH